MAKPVFRRPRDQSSRSSCLHTALKKEYLYKVDTLGLSPGRMGIVWPPEERGMPFSGWQERLPSMKLRWVYSSCNWFGFEFENVY